jgi:type II secretory pathway component HofQ
MRLLVMATLLSMTACGGAGGARVEPGTPAAGAQLAAVDLALKEAPIHEALRALAVAARVNLVVDPEVTGTVSIDVRGAPWRDVLEAIARDHGLRVEQTGPVLRVTPASTPPEPPPSYRGAPIDVSFEDTPIRDAAAALARLAGVAIAIDEDVDSPTAPLLVTMRVRGAPWDLALDHLARKYRLRVLRAGANLRLSRASPAPPAR